MPPFTVRVEAVNVAQRLFAGEPPGQVAVVPAWGLPPSITNAMLPVGVVVPELGLTTAVNVTALPYVDGVPEVETVVVVAMGAVTVRVAVASFLPVSQFPTPLMVYDPGDATLKEKAAELWPAVTVTEATEVPVQPDPE